MAAGLAASGICRSQVSQFCPALFPAMGQRIEALALFGGQAISKPTMHFPPRLMTDLDAEPFERRRPWEDDPTLPALLHDQFGQMAKPVIFDSMRQQPCRQLRRGPRSKRTQPQPVLQLGRMAPAVPFSGQIFVNRVWKNVDLFGNKGKERFRWLFACSQWATRIAQVAKHERLAEAVVVATAPPDHGEVGVRKRVVAHQLTLLRWWIEQRHDLGFAQLLPSHHSCLLDLSGRQTSRSAPGSRSACCA